VNKLGKIALVAVGTAAAVGCINKLQVNEYEVVSDKLPESFDGYTIVHISDYHCACMPELVKRIEKIAPNIIFSTGDMVNRDGSIERAVRITRKLIDIAPLYMVNGNHDFERDEHKKIEEICNRGRGKFLHNERVSIEYKGENISLCGIDDPDSNIESTVEKRMNENLDKLGGYDGFEILLFHRANLADICAERGFDLMLAGHMHGGQFRIPGIGGVISPRNNIGSRGRIFFPKYTGGKYEIGNTDLIVSRGLGNPIPIPRMYNSPEIVVIKLRKPLN